MGEASQIEPQKSYHGKTVISEIVIDDDILVGDLNLRSPSLTLM